MHRRFLLAICCLALATVTGCGEKVAKDPLASVGGYKLVYPQREQRPVDPVGIAAALRTRIHAKNKGDVVVNPLAGGGCEILLPGGSESVVADVKQAIALGNLLKFRIIARKASDDRLIAAAEEGKDPPGAIWVAYHPDKVSLPPEAAVRTTPEGKNMVLTLEGDETVDAWHMEYSMVSRDESLSPCLHGSLNPEGASRMQKLTSENHHRQLAIILDGVVISAPTIQGTVSSQVQITGKFTTGELESLVASLRSAHALGSLEPTPLSEIKVSAASNE